MQDQIENMDFPNSQIHMFVFHYEKYLKPAKSLESSQLKKPFSGSVNVCSKYQEMVLMCKKAIQVNSWGRSCIQEVFLEHWMKFM